MDISNLQQIVQLSAQLQSRMADMQERLEEQEHSATSGGGSVRATVNGKGGVLSISIDPEAVDPEDVEMLEDLVLTALTQAQAEAKEVMDSEMRKATGEMGLPGLGSLLGG